MADAMGNSGIRAEGIRPLALLRKDNYRAWSSKMKAQLKVLDCWRLVSALEAEPAATAPPGTGAAGQAAMALIRTSWIRRRDRAAAVLIISISDEEVHAVQAVDEDPVLIWGRLREKFERRSEAEAETAQMSLLDFAHREGETANETIDRFESVVTICQDQGVVVDENLQKRMLLARPADRYSFLKQSYLLAPIASRPDLVGLKAQIRDIDAEFQKSNSGKVNRPGQANRAETEAAWSQGSSSGGERGSDRGSGRFSGRGGRGGGGRDGGEGGAGNRDVTCYCCGQKGHIKPNCAKRDEKCRKCGKIGHLQIVCNAASERASERANESNEDRHKRQPEAAQFDTYESFVCDVIIGEQLPEAMILEVGLAGELKNQDDKWLGDSGSSHHIKSTRAGMIDVKPCPPGTRIRQVQGVVNVQEWGTVLLEVDGANGKHIVKLCETLIVPSINVNLFSLQRVIDGGFLPVYGEVEGKCLIKKRSKFGDLIQVASMTVVGGRATLDCRLVDHTDSNSGAALQTHTFDGFNANVELDLEEGPPGVDAPPPLDDYDDADGGGGVVAAKDGIPGGGSSGGGSLVGGSPGVGGSLADVDEDAPLQIEGVQAPKMSGREIRGVPPLRHIEINLMAENPVHHRRNKHIGWKWHFIRKRVELGVVKLVDVRTELMGANILTKAVGPAVLGVHMKLIGMSKCG